MFPLYCPHNIHYINVYKIRLADYIVPDAQTDLACTVCGGLECAGDAPNPGGREGESGVTREHDEGPRWTDTQKKEFELRRARSLEATSLFISLSHEAHRNSI